MTTRVYTNPRTGEILDDPSIRPFDDEAIPEGVSVRFGVA